MNSIESLLEQHNSYDLGDRLSIERKPRASNRWFIYFDDRELHSSAPGGNDVLRPFDTAREAMAYLLTETGVKAVEAAKAKAGAP